MRCRLRQRSSRNSLLNGQLQSICYPPIQAHRGSIALPRKPENNAKSTLDFRILATNEAFNISKRSEPRLTNHQTGPLLFKYFTGREVNLILFMPPKSVKKP